MWFVPQVDFGADDFEVDMICVTQRPIQAQPRFYVCVCTTGEPSFEAAVPVHMDTAFTSILRLEAPVRVSSVRVYAQANDSMQPILLQLSSVRLFRSVGEESVHHE